MFWAFERRNISLSQKKWIIISHIHIFESSAKYRKLIKSSSKIQNPFRYNFIFYFYEFGISICMTCLFDSSILFLKSFAEKTVLIRNYYSLIWIYKFRKRNVIFIRNQAIAFISHDLIKEFSNENSNFDKWGNILIKTMHKLFFRT